MNVWKIDPVHSEIKFKVKHLVISTVSGHFDRFDAVIESENEDFSDAKIAFEADVNSINTNNEQRDGHLKSADFFYSENYPKLSFVSRSFEKTGNDTFNLTGDMNMRGISREITLDVIYNGTAKDLYGKDTAAFEISGKLNRFDFGLQWNALTEAGGVAVGSEIKIEIFAEMKKALDESLAA